MLLRQDGSVWSPGVTVSGINTRFVALAARGAMRIALFLHSVACYVAFTMIECPCCPNHTLLPHYSPPAYSRTPPVIPDNYLFFCFDHACKTYSDHIDFCLVSPYFSVLLCWFTPLYYSRIMQTHVYPSGRPCPPSRFVQTTTSKLGSSWPFLLCVHCFVSLYAPCTSNHPCKPIETQSLIYLPVYTLSSHA